MDLLRLFRHRDGSTRRLTARRQPRVEALEGRQLLSGIQGPHIGVVSAHIVAGPAATGGMSADILFPVFAQ